MRLHPALAGLLLATAAGAQPVQPVPTVSAPVEDLLASSPSLTIGNGQIVAHIAPPGPDAFYRGTRFDQAGVITSLKLNGREFYGPWFDRTAPEVLDYAYDHNFMRLVEGNAGTQVTFTFPLTVASNPPPPDLIRVEGKTVTYLRPMKPRERISFLVTGFGNTAADYNIAIRDTAGGGVTIQGDQPITRLNIFAIDKVQSVEPYIAIDLAPGDEKRWRYSYSFTIP